MGGLSNIEEESIGKDNTYLMLSCEVSGKDTYKDLIFNDKLYNKPNNIITFGSGKKEIKQRTAQNIIDDTFILSQIYNSKDPNERFFAHSITNPVTTHIYKKDKLEKYYPYKIKSIANSLNPNSNFHEIKLPSIDEWKDLIQKKHFFTYDYIPNLKQHVDIKILENSQIYKEYNSFLEKFFSQEDEVILLAYRLSIKNIIEDIYLNTLSHLKPEQINQYNNIYNQYLIDINERRIPMEGIVEEQGDPMEGTVEEQGDLNKHTIKNNNIDKHKQNNIGSVSTKINIDNVEQVFSIKEQIRHER